MASSQHPTFLTMGPGPESTHAFALAPLPATIDLLNMQQKQMAIPPHPPLIGGHQGDQGDDEEEEEEITSESMRMRSINTAFVDRSPSHSEGHISKRARAQVGDI